MAYSEDIASRIRHHFDLSGIRVEEKKMFGGVAFMYRGKMCCGVIREEMMVRVPLDQYEHCLKEPAAREMDFTGRPMKGFLYINRDGFGSDEELRRWIGLGIKFVESVI
jgi:TfoX/Sxy family transcriptional regulator of competence genes